MKKVYIAIVLCLVLLLWTGCATEEEDDMPSSSVENTEEDFKNVLSDEESEKILNELTTFCNEHKEKLNEMSEYFLDAVEDLSDYGDESKLPDIDSLAGKFTDEESKEILDKLEPYYPIGYGEEFKQVYYYYSYDYEGEYPDPEFIVVYIKTDGKELERFLEDMDTGWEVRKIDKYLFVVLESWPYT